MVLFSVFLGIRGGGQASPVGPSAYKKVPEAFNIGDTASQRVRLPDFLQAKTAPKLDAESAHFRCYLLCF